MGIPINDRVDNNYKHYCILCNTYICNDLHNNGVNEVNDKHNCTLCKTSYICYDLKFHFCYHGYHGLVDTFICKHCSSNDIN